MLTLSNQEPVEPSSVRVQKTPLIQRRVWVLGLDPKRLEAAVAAIEAAGHQCRSAEPGSEIAPVLREFRPDLIVIDMQDQHDRARHVASQLRADRATRQLPIIMTGVGAGAEAVKTDESVTGPTRRYVLPLDAPSVLGAIVCEL